MTRRSTTVLLLLGLSFSFSAHAQDACPADAFLDVSRFDGPGGDYAKPRLAASCDDDALIVRSNGMPHYKFIQVTPNPLLETDRVYRFPRRPKLAEKPVALPLLGTVGVAVNGIPFFGPNEGGIPYPGFGDPIFNSIMDSCMGHTAREYHYHALLQSCLAPDAAAGEPSPILAFAADGFAVYGPIGCVDEQCSELVEFKSGWDKLRSPEFDAWGAYRYSPKPGPEYLDRCNGHAGTDQGGEYHYHATRTWPYVLGCFSGVPSSDAGQEAPRVSRGSGPPGRPGQPSRRGGRPGGPPPPDQPPTPEQITAAAQRLGVERGRLVRALRLAGDHVAPLNFLASARALGIDDENELSRALGLPVRGLPGRGREGDPERRFNGTSDDGALGCTITEDNTVLCAKECANNKCG